MMTLNRSSLQISMHQHGPPQPQVRGVLTDPACWQLTVSHGDAPTMGASATAVFGPPYACSAAGTSSAARVYSICVTNSPHVGTCPALCDFHLSAA